MKKERKIKFYDECGIFRSDERLTRLKIPKGMITEKTLWLEASMTYKTEVSFITLPNGETYRILDSDTGRKRTKKTPKRAR